MNFRPSSIQSEWRFSVVVERIVWHVFMRRKYFIKMGCVCSMRWYFWILENVACFYWEVLETDEQQKWIKKWFFLILKLMKINKLDSTVFFQKKQHLPFFFWKSYPLTVVCAMSTDAAVASLLKEKGLTGTRSQALADRINSVAMTLVMLRWQQKYTTRKDVRQLKIEKASYMNSVIIH